MKGFTGLALVAVGVAATFLYGCGDNNGMMSNEGALVAKSAPSAGEAAYDPTASIHIKFNTAMDTTRFHEKFFLVDATRHDALHDSLGHGMMSDSVLAICDSMARGMHGSGMDQTMGMMGGGMGQRMRMPGDTHGDMPGNGHDDMMDDDNHMSDTSGFYGGMHDGRMGGQFQWNAMRDSCVFTPDVPMESDRDYVIMMRSMGESMHSGGQGRMMNVDAEDVMIRFHTR